MNNPKDPRFKVSAMEGTPGYDLVLLEGEFFGDKMAMLGPKTAFDLAMAILQVVQAISHVQGIEKDSPAPIKHRVVKQTRKRHLN